MPKLKLALLIASSAAVVTTLGCSDRLDISNGAGVEAGVLVDGRDGGGDVNDRGFLTNAATLEVGNLSAGASNEAVGLTSQRPPRYVATPWTDAGSEEFPPRSRWARTPSTSSSRTRSATPSA